jgi:ABC-type lipoprotein export system ATPase subunit
MTDSATASAAIELREVSKSYGISKDQQIYAADDVSLTIGRGSFVALTGASGSGKSTLLHLIGAMERPDSGSIVAGGTDITMLRGARLAAYRRTVGFVFQRYNLLPALSALDNVIAPLLPTARPSASASAAGNCSRPSASPAASNRCRGRCRAVSSSGSPWPGRSSTTRRSC